ncbi:MerR family transcriptional regulator [Microbacterium sp. 18062]|uniref:MerR family transcriptional regulator n=1 Tax=Microbacterium sp. 18062 TaxID=2681410 RepID=UPI001358065C|nr:MerR family transcriptional regulator [Microbacterium sp. 18062]
MLIGQLADRTDTSRRALRYYEQRGLITAVRDTNGYRTYSTETIPAVLRVRRLLDAGVPVRLIRDVLACACGSDADVEPCMEPELRSQLVRAVRRADEAIAHRDGLRRLLQTIADAVPDRPSRAPDPQQAAVTVLAGRPGRNETNGS